MLLIFFFKNKFQGLLILLVCILGQTLYSVWVGKERGKEGECTGMEKFLLTRPQQFIESSFGIAVEPVYVPYNKISLVSL